MGQKKGLLLHAGATGIVQGSQHLIQIGKDNYVIDLGGINSREEEERKYKTIFPIATNIRGVFITHGHMDHYGKLKKFINAYGFRGPVFATEPTNKIWASMGRAEGGYVDQQNLIYENILKGRIGRTEKEFLGFKPISVDRYDKVAETSLEKKIENIHFWKEHVDISISKPRELAVNVNFFEERRLDDHLSYTFFPSSHILGSAQILFMYENGKKKKRILFTGDIAAKNSFFSEPATPENIDHLIFDATNGDRHFDDSYDPKKELQNIINTTYARGGQTYILAFAVNRMQLVSYLLKQLYKEGKIPNEMDYYLDSPSGMKMTCLFHNQLPYLDNAKFEDDKNPFLMGHNKGIGRSARKSRSVARRADPMVVICTPGMLSKDTLGRGYRHLTTKKTYTRCGTPTPNTGIEDPRNSVIICGYQAEELGQKFVNHANGEPMDQVKMNGSDYQVRAEIHVLKNLSGHMDNSQSLDFIQKVRPRTITLVHAENPAREQLRYDIIHQLGYHPHQVLMPNCFDSLNLN